MSLLLIYAVGVGNISGQASPFGQASHGTVTVDGVTVPDIGPLPTVVPVPASNLNHAAKIELGKQLYFDGRLSKNNAISCIFCHNPGTGFADARQTSIGVGGGIGGRQSPTVYNTAFNQFQFWDGRARSLEEQAIGPIHNPVEMAETHEYVVGQAAKNQGLSATIPDCLRVRVNLQNIAAAIAAYERTVLSTSSAFDKYV